MKTTLNPKRSYGHLKRLFIKRRLVFVGGLIIALVVAVGLLAPILASIDPNTLAVSDRLKPPSKTYLMGTDEFGRDVYSRLLYGARLSMTIGLSVVIISSVVGTAFGLVAGYYRAADNVIMRIMDGIMAFPDILLAIALMASLGPSVGNVIVALGVVYTPRVARIVRSAALSIRETEYIEAARAVGVAPSAILLRHMLPNAVSPIIVQGTFTFANSVLAEASLSFLGVGVPPYVPSWGMMLSSARSYMVQAPWMMIYPGLAIVITVLGLNLLGDGLRDMLDPRLRNL
jgi:peptide/nickel transport system permease protein